MGVPIDNDAKREVPCPCVVASSDQVPPVGSTRSARRRAIRLVEPLPRPDPPDRRSERMRGEGDHPVARGIGAGSPSVRPKAAADAPPTGPGGAGAVSVRAQWRDLVNLPQRPRTVFHWRRILELSKRILDLLGHRRAWWGDLLVRLNPYPHPFRLVKIPSFDGTTISGWLALQPNPRPGLVLVPGMFSSKDDTVHKRRAIRIWRRWNYNVLIIEMRGFGQSQDAPNTPGWKEAEDVLAAARFLRAFNAVTRVGVLGESLGGTATLLAAAQEGIWADQDDAVVAATGRATEDGTDEPTEHARGKATPRRTATRRPQVGPLVGADPTFADEPGGDVDLRSERVIDAVLAFSPFVDPRQAVRHISTRPASRRDPFYRVQRLFSHLLSLHTKGEYHSFVDYMEANAARYDVSIDELYANSDIRSVVHSIRAPTMVLHAEDDATVRIEHADLFREAIRDREDIVAWILPWGGHAEFDQFDNVWFWRVCGRFYGRWLGR